MGTFTWVMMPIALVVAIAAISSGIESPALFVPILRVVLPLLHVPPMSVATAILTSLTIQAVGFSSGSISHLRQGNVASRVVKRGAIPAVLGAVAGTLISLGASGRILELVTVWVILVSLAQISGLQLTQRLGLRLTAGLGAMLTGLVGVGLGPALTSFLVVEGHPPRRAVGSTIPLILMVVLVAGSLRIVSLHLPLTALRWGFIIPAWLGVVLGSQAAPVIQSRVPNHIAKRAIQAVFLCAAALALYDAMR